MCSHLLKPTTDTSEDNHCARGQRLTGFSPSQVHLCPACAELPPDPPTLGVSARYLLDIFPPLARSTLVQENSVCNSQPNSRTATWYNVFLSNSSEHVVRPSLGLNLRIHGHGQSEFLRHLPTLGARSQWSLASRSFQISNEDALH